MDKVKKLFAAFFAVALGFLMLPFPVAAETGDGGSDGRIVVYARLPEDWADPCLWAWSDDGTNAFDAWPGGEMEADTDNEGWYYCWIPKETDNIIINANNAAVQTGGDKIEARNVWVTVKDADTVEVSYEAMTQGEIPAYVETFKVHARVPESWENVGLWAWSAPDGKNAFAAWPGKTMKAGENGWYTANAPVWVNSVIVNGNDGGVQTADISIDAADVWITVAEDGSFDFTYNDPDAPVAEDITVYVKAPADWSSPHLWAWSAPDGTNAFASWPGEALQEGENGWLSLTVPGWINSVIVNGNEGSVQTADLSVEAGRDIWVVVTDAENASVAYEEPADVPEVSPEPESSEPSEAPATTPESPVPSDSEPQEDSEEGGINTAVAVTAVAAVVAAAGAGGAVYAKKKKQNAGKKDA